MAGSRLPGSWRRQYLEMGGATGAYREMRNTARFTTWRAHRLSGMKSNSDYKEHLPGQQQASTVCKTA